MTTDIKPADCIKEAFIIVISPQQGFIDLFSFVGNMRDNIVKSLKKLITKSSISLWTIVLFLAVPWCGKGSEVTIIFMERYTVVTISAFKHCLSWGPEFGGMVTACDVFHW